MDHFSSVTWWVAALSVCALPLVATAQDWSPAEEAVLDRVEECIGFFNNDQFAEVMDCIHDDFSGWLYEDPIVRGKENFATIGRFYMENTAVSAAEFRPVDVILLGDVAVVHYYTYTIYEGSMDISRDRWTDVLARDDGTWRWVADHGGTDRSTLDD